MTHKPLTFGSLFAGIGGFDLGFERAGMVCKWQVEIDPYCQKVLAKHWPNVRRWDDVRTWPQPDTGRVDVICGGFPCQDISIAGHMAGIDGERSGLWREFKRIICVLRPRFVAIENVAALSMGGALRVLADLAEIGLHAEWEIIPACAFGLPHTRERLFIIAHADGSAVQGVDIPKPILIDSEESRRREFTRAIDACLSADAYVRVRGNHDGVPAIMDRLKSLGNAVVPKVAEWIGRRIVEAAGT